MHRHLHSPLPELPADARWVGGAPPSPGELRGVPVLVHFWSVGCDACEAQLPAVARWARELGPRGLRLVGVHVTTQGTPPGTDDEAIRRKAEAGGVRHATLVDDRDVVAAAFGVEATPSYFVYDAAGKLRHFHAGYGADATVERALERVLREAEGAHAQ